MPAAKRVASDPAAIEMSGRQAPHTNFAGQSGHDPSSSSTKPAAAQVLNQPGRSKGATNSAVGSQPPSAGGIAVPAETLVGTVGAAGAVGSRTPGGPPAFRIPGTWLGAASVLPVIDQQAGWVEVRLAQRPNGSTAWVRGSDVTLAVDPYHLVVDLAGTHLRVFKEGQEMATFPAGVGTSAAPTPAGQFFVALFSRAPSAGYGSFLIVTSAHSNTITDWEHSGDAITAIHGSLGADAAIGTTGARISHGCIRLHNADLVQLRSVPAGTPIDIVA